MILPGKNVPLYLFASPSLNLPLLCSPLPLDKTWNKPASAGPEVLGKLYQSWTTLHNSAFLPQAQHHSTNQSHTVKGGLRSHILEHKEKGAWLQVKGWGTSQLPLLRRSFGPPGTLFSRNLLESIGKFCRKSALESLSCTSPRSSWRSLCPHVVPPAPPPKGEVFL